MVLQPPAALSAPQEEISQGGVSSVCEGEAAPNSQISDPDFYPFQPRTPSPAFLSITTDFMLELREITDPQTVPAEKPTIIFLFL